MKTVRTQVSDSFSEKGSKFIGYLSPAEDRKAFEEDLEHIRSRYHDATHHCYAYRIGINDMREVAQDDGEPGGTAGLPILNQLRAHELVNCGLTVVRYFGGTKLGKRGLIQAYGHAAALCVNRAQFVKIVPTLNLEVTYPYDRQNEIDRLKAYFGLTELSSQYLENVTLKLACPLHKSGQLLKELERLEHRNIHHQNLGEDYISK